MNVCPHCGCPYSASDEKCVGCGEHLGFPNVRAANEIAERIALKEKYESAILRAEARGAKSAIEVFETKAAASSAVINCDIHRLRDLVMEGKSLYSNYSLTVRAQVRKAAEGAHDRVRRSVDSLLFGSYAEEIRFGALSIDGRGLKSYGSYSLILRQVAVEKRASLLDENSFSFAQRYDLKPSSEIPAGHRSAWHERHKLAVAKLADVIQPNTPPSSFPEILLGQGTSRSDDEFIEVHIFGPFSSYAVEAVGGNSKPTDRVEKTIQTVIKEHLNSDGKLWIETS